MRRFMWFVTSIGLFGFLTVVFADAVRRSHGWPTEDFALCGLTLVALWVTVQAVVMVADEA